LRWLGNSHGVIMPRPLLAQAGLTGAPKAATPDRR
jgi:antitoxin component of MazEF toxin-antitoxin module